MNKTFRELVPGLAWAAAMIVLAMGASLARRQGIIDQEAVLRLVIGANGLMIVYFGNRMPKALAPSVCAQQLARFSGWSMVLSGGLYAALWALAPIQTAITLGTAAVAVGALATVGYGLHLRAGARSRA